MKLLNKLSRYKKEDIERCLLVENESYSPDISWLIPVVHVFFKDSMQWANKINTIKHEQVDVRCKIYKMSFLDFIFECFWHEQIHGSWRNSSKRNTASAPHLNGRHSILLLNLNDFSKDKFLRILKLLKGLLSEVTVCLLIFFLWIHGAVNKVIRLWRP